MRLSSFILLAAVLLFACRTIPQANTDNDTTLTMKGIPCLADLHDELLKSIPDELKYFNASGLPNNITDFGAYVLAVRDSVGPRIDLRCLNIEYILVLFTNYGSSIITVYSHAGTGISQVWQSKPMLGRGIITLEDLNLDRHNEVIVRLLCTAHEYENVFIFSFVDGRLSLLNPSRELKPISEFIGFVNLDISDTGTVIQSYHPTEAVIRTYFFGIGADRIILVKEVVRDRKHE